VSGEVSQRNRALNRLKNDSRRQQLLHGIIEGHLSPNHHLRKKESRNDLGQGPELKDRLTVQRPAGSRTAFAVNDYATSASVDHRYDHSDAIVCHSLGEQRGDRLVRRD
jgi:hypothetical protein